MFKTSELRLQVTDRSYMIVPPIRSFNSFLRLILLARPSATSRAISLRSSQNSNFFRSQLGRNMVVSPVWLRLKKSHAARTTNICERLQMEIVWSITVWSCNQSEQLVTGRTTDRATAGHQNHERLAVRPRTNGGTITRDWWYDHARHVCVLWSQTDRREFWTWPSTDFARTITYNHPQPLRSVARSLYDLTAIPKFFDRNLVAGFGVTVAIVSMKKVYNLEEKMNHNWQ